MSDKPKPGGYIDRAALARAVRGNRSMAVVLEELIAADGMSRLRRAQLHQRLGLVLAQQRDALAEMEEIRRGGSATL